MFSGWFLFCLFGSKSKICDLKRVIGFAHQVFDEFSLTKENLFFVFAWQIAMEYGNVKTAVFWDYASLQIPPYVDVKSIVHNLMLKLRQKKCYGRLYGTCIQAEHKEAFQRTGIELIDVQVNSSTFSYSCEIDQPHSDAQTSTEKMYNPPPAIVVVISRNRDFVVSVTELCQQMQH